MVVDIQIEIKIREKNMKDRNVVVNYGDLNQIFGLICDLHRLDSLSDEARDLVEGMFVYIDNLPIGMIKTVPHCSIDEKGRSRFTCDELCKVKKPDEEKNYEMVNPMKIIG